MVYMSKSELISKIQMRGWLLGVGYVIVAVFVAKLVAALPLLVAFLLVCLGYILVQWWFDRQVKKLVNELGR
jgi:hypothetical protein